MRSRTPLASLVFVVMLAGCARELDMARAYDERRAATTIPYTGVREELRQYPDYSAIGASILASPEGEKAGPASKNAKKEKAP